MNKAVARLDVAQDARVRFTTADFLHMAASGAFDDMNVELVDGKLQRMNRPMSRHAWRQSKLSAMLWQAVHGTALQIFSDGGIDIGGDTVRGFDVGIASILPETNRLLHPEEIVLVIEIAESSIARDLGPKRSDYAGAGISHYWVVDNDRSVTHIFTEPRDGEYTNARTAKFGDAIDVPGTDKTILID